MGRRDHHPHRGSLGYAKRSRAASPIPRIRNWIEDNGTPRIQGYSGYKAGTTHVVMVDDYKFSPTKGEEVARMVTVVETPPIKVYGLRLYGRDTRGLKILGEAWAKEVDKDISKVIPMPKNIKDRLGELEGKLEETVEVRALVHTQPKLTGIGKKRPEIMEYKVSGNSSDAFNYIKEKLGTEIKFSEIFQEGDYLDVLGVTKGHGFDSPLHIWGTKHLPRKTRKGHNTAGNLGPTNPAAMMWTVPQNGQRGYQQRTEYNKRILKISDDGKEIVPAGGFLGYGNVKNEYAVLEGSLPGHRKRLLRMRAPIRPNAKTATGKPQINYISISSKQGA